VGRFGEERMLNLPNSLTIFRIFLVPVLVVVLLTKFEGKEILGVVIFLVAATTDALDGFVARRRGQVTALGTLLDPVADKLLVSAALISLVEEGLAPAWMVVIIVGRELAVSGLRSLASQRGIEIAASVWGKFKMVSQVLAIVLLILDRKLPLPFSRSGETVLWVVVVLAVFSAADYFIRFYRSLGFADQPKA
jgi:CDP-diacylglycerol--glycerol-3-phosphate 3-phosphatidyltransferase